MIAAEELHKLLAKNDLAGIAHLLRQKNIVNQPHRGSTLLRAAASMAQDDAVRLLLRHGAIADAADKIGTTALMLACMHGYDSTAEILIQAGADPNACDNKGWTPLHHAAYFGLVHIIEFLLSRNAVPDAVTLKGRTALDFTLDGRYVEAVLLLQRAGLRFEDTSLARTRKAKAARKWLEQSAPALHAVQTGNAAQLEACLAAGTDVNTRNEIGFTLLMLAAQGSQEDMVKLLLRFGANVNAYAPSGWTALERAANGGHIDIVNLLLEQGATVHPPVDNAWSAIASAAWRGHIKIVERLLALATYTELENALFQAKKEDHPEIVLIVADFMQVEA